MHVIECSLELVRHSFFSFCASCRTSPPTLCRTDLRQRAQENKERGERNRGRRKSVTADRKELSKMWRTRWPICFSSNRIVRLQTGIVSGANKVKLGGEDEDRPPPQWFSVFYCPSPLFPSSVICQLPVTLLSSTENKEKRKSWWV